MFIFGAIFLNNTTVEPLTPFIPLTPTAYDNKNLGYIARVLEALRLGLTTLDMFYSQRQATGSNGDQLYFPHFNSFTTGGTTTRFNYIYPHARD